MRRPEFAGMSSDWRDPCWPRCGWRWTAAWSPTSRWACCCRAGWTRRWSWRCWREEGQRGLKTFSVGFHATGGETGDEFEYSDLVAQQFGTDHQQILVDPHRLLPAVDEAITAMAEPMVSHDCVAFYLLSEEVAKSVTVVQSGQGADEVLAGYSWYPPLARVPRERGRGVRQGLHRPPHAELAEILEPDWLLDDDPSRRFIARALRHAGRGDDARRRAAAGLDDHAGRRPGEAGGQHDHGVGAGSARPLPRPRAGGARGGVPARAEARARW